MGGDTVDMVTAGTYTITYDVSDAAGNFAVQQTRIVTVEEAPAVELLDVVDEEEGVTPSDIGETGTSTPQQ